MVTLPCLHEGYVRGVLTLGLPCKVVPPELLAALTQLAYQVTPFIVEANPDLAPWMCQPRLQRFRSFNDIAASLLDDLVNLDKFLITSLTAPDLSSKLAYQVTPFIVEANPDLAPWMCQPRLQRFRSFNDIAASLLDDLVNLDKFLITSLTAPDLSQWSQHEPAKIEPGSRPSRPCP
ncbi:uncharacterized protein HaLaN_23069 [Haematococcus lacustris]|uniref:Uncharacterized protein n=1 Tax=Haematococcus lacustris TaxID=44745 RepID=A0A699ZZA4_HAELA|nr:uncharacterized protein HaLaN_23069 [Haematococcus lacustris]